MKITQSRLKQIIKEELENVQVLDDEEYGGKKYIFPVKFEGDIDEDVKSLQTVPEFDDMLGDIDISDSITDATGEVEYSMSDVADITRDDYRPNTLQEEVPETDPGIFDHINQIVEIGNLLSNSDNSGEILEYAKMLLGKSKIIIDMVTYDDKNYKDTSKMGVTEEQLQKIIEEELSYIIEGGNLQNTAKGAAMSLLDTAKVMEQSPSHEPASLYVQEVAKQANLIMDMLVDMEGGTDGYESAPSANQQPVFGEKPQGEI